MGHVVEGILATYSPYYIPAPVEIYFLEDFRSLQNALPQVSPTIFFAVPRVYEKVWEALRKELRWPIISTHKQPTPQSGVEANHKKWHSKRAGLNKCAQLIVGSASCGDDLLENYRPVRG